MFVKLSVVALILSNNPEIFVTIVSTSIPILETAVIPVVPTSSVAERPENMLFALCEKAEVAFEMLVNLDFTLKVMLFSALNPLVPTKAESVIIFRKGNNITRMVRLQALLHFVGGWRV